VYISRFSHRKSNGEAVNLLPNKTIAIDNIIFYLFIIEAFAFRKNAVYLQRLRKRHVEIKVLIFLKDIKTVW